LGKGGLHADGLVRIANDRCSIHIKNYPWNNQSIKVVARKPCYSSLCADSDVSVSVTWYSTGSGAGYFRHFSTKACL
jgi:hypothetical protein